MGDNAAVRPGVRSGRPPARTLQRPVPQSGVTVPGPAEVSCIPADDEIDPLRSAASPPELWLALLLHDMGGESSDILPAEECLRRLHGSGQPGAVQTALLLITAWRWRRCTARLIGPLVATGVLDDAELDELASRCLEDTAAFTVPASTFDGPTVVLASWNRTDDQSDNPGVPVHADRVMTRLLPPPPRRWGAARRLTQHPEELQGLLARIAELEPRHAAAAMTGVLDAHDHLPVQAAADVVARALTWPHAGVRKLAHALSAPEPAPEPSRTLF